MLLASKEPTSLIDTPRNSGDPMLHAEVAPNYEDEIQTARDRAVRDIEQMLKVQVAEVAESQPRSNRTRLYYTVGAVAVILAVSITGAILLLTPKEESAGGDTFTTTNFGDDSNSLQQYFMKDTFIQVFEGAVDGSYAVTCVEEATAIGIVATNATSGTDECVDSLPPSTFKSICESNSEVNVWLEGDYRGLVLALGFLRDNNDFAYCTSSGSGLVLKSNGGEYPSSTDPTTSPIASPTEFETVFTTPRVTQGPSLFPTANTPADSTNSTAYTGAYTPSCGITYTLRSNVVGAILAPYAPLDDQTMTWLVEIDTWEPGEGEPNSDYLWLERYALGVLYYNTNGPQAKHPIVDWKFE
ncbi:MAG: hypothetical protein SGBAC_005768 [Bacillariaceae sp.]